MRGETRAQAPAYSTHRLRALRLPTRHEEDDVVAVEEPLEIRIGGEPVAVTMRTPGHDEELALGFCLTEGLRPVAARLPDDLGANTVDVEATGFDPERLRRSFYTSSSCGVCGKGAIEAVQVAAPRVESRLTVEEAVIASLPERLLTGQSAFAATGGVHATGLFSADGDLMCVREDVGRHNALDKVIGAMAKSGEKVDAGFLVVTSRASYEMVQKSATVGIALLAAISAPTALAIHLAEETRVTLIGFARAEGHVVYANPQRITGAASEQNA